uniref:Uncharacterized protein n=1 Tax=Pristionchus pacificus TaxID=54126 RepID=A0A2A6CJU4_PRIPA|eukprot:PDM78472.1 hypothetical protein PRIPAC_31051 [Pristionchus pacificus]
MAFLDPTDASGLDTASNGPADATEEQELGDYVIASGKMAVEVGKNGMDNRVIGHKLGSHRLP